MLVSGGNLGVVFQESCDVQLLTSGGKPLATLYGHVGPVRAFDMLHDGRLVTGADDGHVKVWPEVQSLKTDSFRPDGAFVVPKNQLVRGNQSASSGKAVNIRVRVFLQRAEQLPAADTLASDPFVRCRVVDGCPGFTQTPRTKVKLFGGERVTWNETLSVLVPDGPLHDLELLVRVYDYDVSNEDDILAWTSVNVASLVAGPDGRRQEKPGERFTFDLLTAKLLELEERKVQDARRGARQSLWGRAPPMPRPRVEVTSAVFERHNEWWLEISTLEGYELPFGDVSLFHKGSDP